MSAESLSGNSTIILCKKTCQIFHWIGIQNVPTESY